MKIGSLFSGYGGLDMAAQAVLGGQLAWYSDVCRVDDDGTVGHLKPHGSPCRILAHHHPDLPNLGDISAVDWRSVEPVDVLAGGFPCQDVSHAGKRAGMRPDTRSGLWSQMAYAIDQLRPRLVVAENVRGLLSAEAASDVEPCPWCVGDDATGALRALGAVLGDLADIGYDAQWVGLRAADVGLCHGRFRVFVVAWPTDTESDPGWIGYRDGGAAPDADSAGRAQLGRVGAGERDADRRSSADTAWGIYEPAIRQHERVIGRLAPSPTELAAKGGRRLSPRFVEWMQGLPAGHVTDPAIWADMTPSAARNAQLKALGNGVVPQQAAAALRHLFPPARAQATS